jgi:hypothetical protein
MYCCNTPDPQEVSNLLHLVVLYVLHWISWSACLAMWVFYTIPVSLHTDTLLPWSKSGVVEQLNSRPENADNTVMASLTIYAAYAYLELFNCFA